MDIPSIKFLIKNLFEETSQAVAYSTGRLVNETISDKYKNLINVCEEYLSEHSTFLRASYHTEKKDEILSALNYIALLIDLLEKEMEKKSKNERKFLDSAQDKLNQAGASFNNQDFSGVSNKLNTAVELALKDTLDIPSTITGINTSKIIDILISEGIGPVEYLKEVRNHVLMDNLVKHQGMSPIEARAVTAITAVRNLFERLKEPIILKEEIKNKIWSRE